MRRLTRLPCCWHHRLSSLPAPGLLFKTNARSKSSAVLYAAAWMVAAAVELVHSAAHNVAASFTALHTSPRTNCWMMWRMEAARLGMLLGSRFLHQSKAAARLTHLQQGCCYCHQHAW